MVIRPEPLTRVAFRPFGEVIELEGVEQQAINEGHTAKFAGLAALVATDGAPLALHLYRSQPVGPLVEVRTLERHPLGSQAFIPLHARPFPVVVAPAGSPPHARDVRAFLTNGRQGVNLAPGTWHHYQLSLGQESDYLVIERDGAGPNCDEHRLPETLAIRF